jgi:hypothetical protein
MPSPSSGADADELIECAGECCLVIKSRLNRDVDQRHAGLAHQLLGVVNAMLNQPLVSGGAERGFEMTGFGQDCVRTRRPPPSAFRVSWLRKN